MGLHPDKSNDAYSKLVDYLAFIMQRNLLFHRLSSWSDQDGGKILVSGNVGRSYAHACESPGK